jgi:hypothetical protein
VDCALCKFVEVDDQIQLCNRCSWAVHTLAQEGCLRFATYLQRWAEFREWELAHPKRARRSRAAGSR